jgi:hypothetical protein
MENWKKGWRHEEELGDEVQKYPAFAHPLRDCAPLSFLPKALEAFWYPEERLLDTSGGASSEDKGGEAFFVLFHPFLGKQKITLAPYAQSLAHQKRYLLKGESIFGNFLRPFGLWIFPEPSSPRLASSAPSLFFASVDAYVDTLHFRKSYLYEAGFYSAVAALSDLSQGQAIPRQLWGFLIHLSEDSPFCQGVEELQHQENAPSFSLFWKTLKAPDPCFPSSVVWVAVGEREEAGYLSEAPLEVGMSLYVLGSLGGSCNQGYRPHLAYLREQYLLRYQTGILKELTVEDRVRDISDGLERTLKIWLQSSNRVNFVLSQASFKAMVSSHFPQTSFLEQWQGGDDYALLIASTKRFPSLPKLVKIGEVVSGQGQIYFS